MIQANLLQYFSKKSDSWTGQSSLFSVVSSNDSIACKNSSEVPKKKPKKLLSLRRKKTSKLCRKNKATSNRHNVIKESKDLKSYMTQVETISNTLLATPSSKDDVKVEDDITDDRNSVKRNLFGTLPLEVDELPMDKSSPLSSINFSFHSPIKGVEETIPDSVSIHESVSSALHQLPSLGDNDTAMIVDDNQCCDNNSIVELDCSEDDRWLENVSSSAWEGQTGGASQEMGGANPARVLRRFIIQSVLFRQQTDPLNDESGATDNPRPSREMVLELKSISSSPTHSGKADDNISLCLLRDDWMDSELLPGYKIQLVGCCDNMPTQCHIHVIDGRPGRFVIVVPDLLVSATTMATATGCMRRAVLAELFKGTGGHEVMLLGSLLHQVFEQVQKKVLMSFRDTNSNITDVKDHVIQLIYDTVNTFPSIMSMYGVGVSQDHVIEKLLEYVPMLVNWMEQFMGSPGKGEIEFRRTPSCEEDNQWIKSCYVDVSGVHDIEECIWSPRFGLKGKIDATVEVKMHTIRRPRNPQLQHTQQELLEQFTVPLELKTGKMGHPLGSVDHRAQVMLYALMLSEHYDGEIPGGLLYYLKAGHMVGVPAFDYEIRALVMMRNKLATYLYSCYTNKLPEMLRYAHTCQYCPLLQSCCMFHKCVEDGTAESSGLKELFDQNVQHVTDNYKKFFNHWYHLACLEVWYCRRDNKEALWAQDTRNQMQHGLCINQLTAGQVSKQPDGTIIQTLHSDSSSVPAWGGESRFVVGERVIISRQDGRGWGVATGYIKCLRNTTIDIVINKSLATNNSILYRLDISQSHIGVSHVMLSNLMSLMTRHNERGHRLRKLIIDGVEPVFGDACYYDNSLVSNLNNGQREAIQKVMSSKDYTIILGMPGTGKTLTIAALVRVLVSNGNSVLLASYTNTAIDNILLKLTQMGLDFLRLGSAHKVHPNLIGYTTAAMANKVSNLEDLSNNLDSKPIVATTCLGINHEVFEQRVFDYCIIDEASQVTLPVCLGAIQYASQCFVLVGDHYQLSPLVESEEARNKGLSVSLFQLLSNRHPSSVVYLWQQFRMNQDIMLLSNTLVYNHSMECGSNAVAMATLNLSNWASIRNRLPNWLNHSIEPTHPVVFINTDQVSGDKGETKGSHDQIYNELEADMVTKLVTTLINCGCSCDDIGVITPYRQQQHLIRSRLCSSEIKVSPIKLSVSKHTTECSGVEVFTVDRYQGRDKPCIIVSFVRNNTSASVGSLLPDMHRINVAMTRGQHKLIMIGAQHTLRNAPPLAKLLTLLTRHNMIFNMA